MWTDEDSDMITFDVKQIINSSPKNLPNWIEMDWNLKNLKIKPLFPNLGTYTIQIIALDPYNGKGIFEINLEVYTLPQFSV